MIDDLLRPFSARSLIASALLGSHPPRLPGRHLVAMAERFDISGGTARVALSRMVDRGELVNDGGTYQLAGPLLERQERQDRGRVAPDRPWDGRWELGLVVTSGRSAADRSALRRHLLSLGLGERREGAWMRPANLDPDRQPKARDATVGQIDWLVAEPVPGPAARALVGALFDLEAWSTIATALSEALTEAERRLDEDTDAVVTGFTLAAAALRHLSQDPLLPAELQPDGWPADDLRSSYARYERSYQRLLRAFFQGST